MFVKSKSPLRVSFAGGSSDVSPYPERYGGAVISTAISKYAYSFLRPREDSEIKVHSFDYDISEVAKHKEELKNDDSLGLVNATIKTMHVGDKGFDLTIFTEAPLGSGLGSSSAVVVSLIGAFKEWLNLPLTSYEIAKIAFHIEREILGIAGGLQDFYSACFGGVNFMEFHKDSVVVLPLNLKPETINELISNLILVDTKRSRLSANILSRQQDAYRVEKEDVMENIHEIKKLAYIVRDKLLLGDLKNFGMLLNTEWYHKQKLDPMISDSNTEHVYKEAGHAGVLGGKGLGAGGGGHFILYCDYGKKIPVQRAVEKLGWSCVPFSFEDKGLQTWKINENGVVQF